MEEGCVATKRSYEIITDRPLACSWDEYEKHSYSKYLEILDKNADDEKVFQQFFEKNPSFVPGASGHGPYANSLIAEPEIDSAIFRKSPDFIWLSQDSLNFRPILIEIEKPSKRTFTRSADPTAELTHALNQIVSWKTILDQPENILMFYKYFDIPENIRKKTFVPQYSLIYGRRSEYENNPELVRLRSRLAPENVTLMSYDRIRPSYECGNMLCCKMKRGEYIVRSIPPTFEYGPMISKCLSLVKGFCEAISGMEITSQDRKNFLISRYEYWREFGVSENKGIIYTGDRE